MVRISMNAKLIRPMTASCAEIRIRTTGFSHVRADPHIIRWPDLSFAVDPSRSDSGPGTEGQALPRVYLLPVSFLARWLSWPHGWA
ncbi:hypothetical protein Mame01_40080 [Microbispora amethystogenes]|nr:hypothetical protein Mame01_40080 [Microbispora amethystogenes]